MSYMPEVEDVIANDKSGKTPIGVLINQGGAMSILYEEKDLPINLLPGIIIEGTVSWILDEWKVFIIPTLVNRNYNYYDHTLGWAAGIRDLGKKTFINGQTISVQYRKCSSQKGWFVFFSDFAILGWKKLLNQLHEGDIVEGHVVAQTNDGLMVKIFTFDAVLPLSELDSDAFRKPKDFVGRTIKVKILKIYEDLHKVIVSRQNLTSHPKKNAGNENKSGGSDVIKELQSRIGKLESRIEQLETELKKLKEEPQSSLRSTVEKHDGWW